MTTPKPVPDDLLAILVNVLNRFTERPDDRETEGIGITLTVGGAVITGQMISNTAWFDDMDQKIQDAGGGPWATVFSAKAEGLRAQLGEASAAEQAVEDLADRFAAAVYQVGQTGLIHLKNARVLTPGSGAGIPGNGMHWRGRLTEVSGWAFGLLSAGD